MAAWNLYTLPIVCTLHMAAWPEKHAAIWPRVYSNMYCRHAAIYGFFCSDLARKDWNPTTEWSYEIEWSQNHLVVPYQFRATFFSSFNKWMWNLWISFPLHPFSPPPFPLWLLHIFSGHSCIVKFMCDSQLLFLSCHTQLLRLRFSC